MSDVAPVIDAFGLTHVGAVRPKNEDQFVIAGVRKQVDVKATSVEALGSSEKLRGPEAHLFVVADGVGGHAGGERASGFAVQALAEYLGTAAGCFQRFDTDAEHDFLEALEQAVHRAHEALVRESAGRQGGPATTLTMVTLVWPRAYLVHVGDTRAYVLHGGRLRQLTRDQTMAEFLVDAGGLTEEQAKTSRTKDMLISALGGSSMAPNVGLIDLEPGDTLMLCSDGLTKHVDDREIHRLLALPAGAESRCRQLVDASLAGGGSDNITVVVAQMGAP
ncbi:MAG: protein phosphatase 2C domain-containing protein [Gemmatimonadales bacterium]|nr:protein phosphatase 2C domain-containing protein [Gemmatimonadales bacterium]